MASDITVAALTASPRVRGNKLDFTTANDPWPSDIHYGLDVVEIWASTTNDRATATKIGEGKTEVHHSGLNEEETWYYWARARNRIRDNPDFGPWTPSGATSGLVCKTLGQAGQAFSLNNGLLVSLASANSITFSVVTPAFLNPSPANPVYIAFPAAGSGYRHRKITSALSVTISAGSTLGVPLANKPFRVWVQIWNDFLTDALVMTAGNCWDGKSVHRLVERASTWDLDTGAGTADTAGYQYGNTTPGAAGGSSRIIGYAEWPSGLAVLGQWVAPSRTVLFSAGARKPGDIIEHIMVTDAAYQSHTQIIPFDDTVPLSSDGDAKPTLSWSVPSAPSFTSEINVIEVEAKISATYSVAAQVTAALFNGSTLLDVDSQTVAAANQLVTLTLAARYLAENTTPALSVRTGGDVAGTTYINGTSAGRKFGGACRSVLIAREIMV